MSKKSFILNKYIETCELHLQRIEDSLFHIRHLLPFEESKFPIQTYQDLSSLDMFSMRLSKLQDTMGSKLIPLFLYHLGESTDGLSTIDMMNKLQKLHIIEDISTWQKLRDIRNIIAHEYPDSYDIISKTLNEAIALSPFLSTILANIKKRVQCLSD